MSKTSTILRSFQELGSTWTVRTHVQGDEQMVERENGTVAGEEEAVAEEAAEETDDSSEEESE